MPSLYPLRFEPILRRYIWGGRRLGESLGKNIGPEGDFAESWEIVDREADQSVVSVGPLKGKTLREIIKSHGEELLGRDADSTHSFPLLFKFLDCNRDLSIQVHPDDAAAARLDPPDLGKTEAWVILDAQPGSRLFAGLKRGFDRAAVEREISRGTLPLCLNQITPNVGDCIFMPAGAVHALGAGMLVAEIQQASDTTYRLFDWNRVGTDGKPRPLHIEQSLAAIDFSLGPLAPQVPVRVDSETERLVECDKFTLDRMTISATKTLATNQRFQILIVIEGSVSVEGDATDEPLSRGQTILIPASAGATKLTPHEKSILLIANA